MLLNIIHIGFIVIFLQLEQYTYYILSIVYFYLSTNIKSDTFLLILYY